VYGGTAAAEAAGFTLPPPEQLATHVDWATWQLYLKALANLLRRNDIEQVRSRTSEPVVEARLG